MASTTLLGAIPIYFAILLPIQCIGFYAGIVFPSGFLLSQASIAVGTVIMNVSLPETRGTIFSINNLSGRIGNALGPIFVSLLIVATNENRPIAFTISVSFWGIVIILEYLCSFFIKQDIERIEAEEKRRMTQESSSTSSQDQTKSDEDYGGFDEKNNQPQVASDAENTKDLTMV